MKQMQDQAERALRYVDQNRQSTPPETQKWIYAAQDLTLTYGTKTAYRNVTFCIPEKRLTAIIGPSGCGKSSLLMTLSGFVNKIAGSDLSGQVLFNDQPLYDTTTDTNRCGTTIGYVFQKPVPFPVSIYRNMTLALRDYGVTRRGDLDERVEKGLRQVGLWDEVKDRLKDSALTLSGGQQQRLCIARALTLEPTVLLMDEPCSALDPIASRVVEELIKNLSQTYTVIVVTHNLAQARRVSDDVAFFWVKEDAGMLVEHGTTADIFENPQDALTKAYVRGYSG